jgi:hypothetical protein
MGSVSLDIRRWLKHGDDTAEHFRNLVKIAHLYGVAVSSCVNAGSTPLDSIPAHRADPPGLGAPGLWLWCSAAHIWRFGPGSCGPARSSATSTVALARNIPGSLISLDAPLYCLTSVLMAPRVRWRRLSSLTVPSLTLPTPSWRDRFSSLRSSGWQSFSERLRVSWSADP